MNELANQAEVLCAQIDKVYRDIGSDLRIGYHFLYAGCGFEGPCFSMDRKVPIKIASDDVGINLKVLTAVDEFDSTHKHVLAGKIKGKFGDLQGRRLALWGLAFKPNRDDMREAPSLELIEELLASGATFTTYAPVAMHEAGCLFGEEPRLTYSKNPMEALDRADALVIVTEWKEFRSPDLEDMKKRMKFPAVFDGRNLYDPKYVRDMGFEYYPIGR